MNQPAIPSVADIMTAMEHWAPAWTAETWDRVGLLCGNPKAPAQRIWVALDFGEEVLSQALADQAQMLLVHHPPLFKPITDLRTDKPATARLLRALKGDLAVFAAHTNLDAAPGGVNDKLAETLGLHNIQPLLPLNAGDMAKLVVFVPREYVSEVEQAIFKAGAGRMGLYSQCSFTGEGQGAFYPQPGAQPFCGAPGQREMVPEVRLETLIPLSAASPIMAALLEAHPYQSPAVDIISLQNSPHGLSLGRIGELTEPCAPEEFVRRAAASLRAPGAFMAGVWPAAIKRVAVLGGSGAEALAVASAKGAEVLVTGEARYQTWQEAEDLGIGILNLGHFNTENIIVRPWAEYISNTLTEQNFICQVRAWSTSPDPWRWIFG